MSDALTVAEQGSRIAIENYLVRFTFDATQGGNCVEGLWKPLNVPLLCTNYHSTDLFASADGIGYFTTGDANGVLTVRDSGPERAVVVAESQMACRRPSKGAPPSCGCVERVYEVDRDASSLTVHVTFVLSDAKESWNVSQLRMIDMETNHNELTHFATQDAQGNPFSGPVDDRISGFVKNPSFDSYTLCGSRLAVTTRFDNIADLDSIYAENGSKVVSVGIPGTALLAFWIRSQPQTLSAGTTFRGTLNIRLRPVEEPGKS